MNLHETHDNCKQAIVAWALGCDDDGYKRARGCDDDGYIRIRLVPRALSAAANDGDDDWLHEDPIGRGTYGKDRDDTPKKRAWSKPRLSVVGEPPRISAKTSRRRNPNLPRMISLLSLRPKTQESCDTSRLFQSGSSGTESIGSAKIPSWPSTSSANFAAKPSQKRKSNQW